MTITKTSTKLIEEYTHTAHRFNTVKEYQEYLRDGQLVLDYVAINGILYTIEEYDMAGKQISYCNKRTTLGFIVETQDRYSEAGFSDATIEEPTETGCYRNDITFAD